jgi:hypothetical protein
MRSHENDRRRVAQRGQVARDFQPAHARHLDVEQQHLGAGPGKALERFEPVCGLAHHARGKLRRDVGKQFRQTRSRRRLVIGDEDARLGHAGPDRYGISISTE